LHHSSSYPILSFVYHEKSSTNETEEAAPRSTIHAATMHIPSTILSILYHIAVTTASGKIQSA
jgi:hypothetical protein